jgi:hypothetical protein
LTRWKRHPCRIALHHRRNNRRKINIDQPQTICDYGAIGNVPIGDKVSLVNRHHESGDPSQLVELGDNARRKHTVSGEHGRAAKGQSKRFTEALQITPHVTALRRINVEWRIVPSLRFEDWPQQKSVPLNVDVVRLSKSLDAHCGGIRIGAGEVKPKLQRHNSEFLKNNVIDSSQLPRNAVRGFLVA